MLAPLPASASTISLFLAFMLSKSSSYSYITAHLNSIRIVHLAQGFPTDSLTSFEVSLTKKGLKRILGTTTTQKRPITAQILQQFRIHLRQDCPSHAAIWCLFLVAFFSFLRKTNLTASSAARFSPQNQLTRGDLKFTESGAVLRIRWTKTLQHKQGILMVPLPSIPGSDLCPISAIKHFFKLVPAPQSAPFFCLPTSSGLRPITAHTFTSSLKKLISDIGLDPKDYSPHSFRRGGATHAYRSGVPEHLIKLHGDWRSDAYQAYLTLPLTTRFKVADIMATGLT